MPFSKKDNNEIAKIHWQIRTIEPVSIKLGRKHSWVKGIQACSNEGPCPFPWGDNYKMAKIHWQISKSSSPEPLGQFQPNLAQSIPGGFAMPFSKKDNYKIAKIHWQIRTIEPVSTKLGTKHSWMKGIQVYSNEGQHPF